MSRIIYSLYSENVGEHMSSTDYKKNQFKKYKLHLETKQLEYATKVSADYKLYIIKETDYDKIQFICFEQQH